MLLLSDVDLLRTAGLDALVGAPSEMRGLLLLGTHPGLEHERCMPIDRQKVSSCYCALCRLLM